MLGILLLVDMHIIITRYQHKYTVALAKKGGPILIRILRITMQHLHSPASLRHLSRSYMIFTQTHTVGLLGKCRRLREGSLARKGRLECSTKAGGEVVGCSVSKPSWHTHGACSKRCCRTPQDSYRLQKPSQH